MLKDLFYVNDLKQKIIVSGPRIIGTAIHRRHFGLKIILFCVGDAMSSGNNLLVCDKSGTTHATVAVAVDCLNGHAEIIYLIFNVITVDNTFLNSTVLVHCVWTVISIMVNYLVTI